MNTPRRWAFQVQAQTRIMGEALASFPDHSVMSITDLWGVFVWALPAGDDVDWGGLFDTFCRNLSSIMQSIGWHRVKSTPALFSPFAGILSPLSRSPERLRYRGLNERRVQRHWT